MRRWWRLWNPGLVGILLLREVVHAEILELVKCASRQRGIFVDTNTRSVLAANGGEST